MKKYNLLLVLSLLLVILFSPSEVKADNPDGALDDGCLSNKTCMLVCNYKTSPSAAEGNISPRNTSILYDFVNDNWMIKYDAQYTVGGLLTYQQKEKGFDPFSYIFSDEGDIDIYIPKKHTKDKFTCPTYSYLDFGWNILFQQTFNSVCFDNNGSWCEKDKSSISSDFDRQANKSYDFNEELGKLFNMWYLNGEVQSNLTCTNIYNNTTDENVYDMLMNEFVQDMSNMYLFNGAAKSQLPNFIINSSGWKNVSNTLENDVYELTNTCRDQTERDYTEGRITEEEYNNRLNKLNDYDNETEEAANRQTTPRTNNATTENWNKEIECEDIFDFDDPGSVGWMLNTIFNYIKIIGPILVVLLSSIDFIKAVVGFDEKAMKEAQNKLIIRLVAAVALFLIPTLVQLLLSFINQASCYLP